MKMNNLRKERMKLNLPMSIVCKRVGVPYRTWQDWELGNSRTPQYAFNLLKGIKRKFRIIPIYIKQRSNVRTELIRKIELYMHHAINEGLDIPALDKMLFYCKTPNATQDSCNSMVDELIQQICEDMITTIDPDYFDKLEMERL